MNDAERRAMRRDINFFAIDKFHRTHRFVREGVIGGQRYEWWKREDGTLVLIGPVKS